MQHWPVIERVLLWLAVVLMSVFMSWILTTPNAGECETADENWDEFWWL